MKNKFNCVEMKNKSSIQIYKIIANFTKKEELEYWRKKEYILNKRKYAIGKMSSLD